MAEELPQSCSQVSELNSMNKAARAWFREQILISDKMSLNS